MAEPRRRGATSSTAAKVQEAAANIHQPARKRITPASAAGGQRGGDGGAALLRGDRRARPRRGRGDVGDGGREHVRGQVDVQRPEGVREFIGGLLDAVPDLRLEVVSTTTRGRALRACSGA